MTFSNSMAESLGRLIFQNTVTAALPLADLNVTAGAVTSLSLALHTGPINVGDAQTVNEVSTGTWPTYARQLVSRTAGNWPFTSPNLFQNGVTITFPANTGTATTVSWLSIGSNTSNRVIFRLPLALETPKPFSLLDPVTNETIHCFAHGYSADFEVVFIDVEGAALPTGITEGQVYWVRSGGLTSDAFTIAATQGGAAVGLTATGGDADGGLVARVSQKTINTNDNLVFDTSNLISVFIR